MFKRLLDRVIAPFKTKAPTPTPKPEGCIGRIIWPDEVEDADPVRAQLVREGYRLVDLRSQK
jgi:hypothetical protein